MVEHFELQVSGAGIRLILRSVEVVCDRSTAARYAASMTTTTPAWRTETDSLGEVRVPAGAYYGAQTQRAVENFAISGMRSHPALIRATALIKYASARANRQLGKLDERLATAIQQAAQEIADGGMRDQFVVDVFQAGAGTSYNMNANEVIANRANELLGGELGVYKPIHPNDHVNMSQSTNDTVPAAIRIAALELTPAILDALGGLGFGARRQGP